MSAEEVKSIYFLRNWNIWSFQILTFWLTSTSSPILGDFADRFYNPKIRQYLHSLLTNIKLISIMKKLALSSDNATVNLLVHIFFVRILTGKTHCQIKLKRSWKVWVWNYETLTDCVNVWKRSESANFLFYQSLCRIKFFSLSIVKSWNLFSSSWWINVRVLLVL